METWQILVGIVTINLAVLTLINNERTKPDIQRVLAWCFAFFDSFALPTAFFIWFAMRLWAWIFSQSPMDFPSYVARISWSVGISSIVWPLIWAFKFYPKIKKYIFNKYS